MLRFLAGEHVVVAGLEHGRGALEEIPRRVEQVIDSDGSVAKHPARDAEAEQQQSKAGKLPERR